MRSYRGPLGEHRSLGRIGGLAGPPRGLHDALSAAMQQERCAKVKFLFGDFVLDADRRELRRAGQLQPIEPRALDLLELLLRHPTRVISKAELRAAIWKGQTVSESALTNRISAIRAAVGDSGADQRLIRAYARKGLRFVGEVREEPTSDGPPGEIARSLSQYGLASSSTPSTMPSIAVLPLRVIGEGVSEYFAEGIVEDIVLSLASLHELFVVSRGSTLSFRRSKLTPAAIGETLGVRYIVAGSIRQDGEALRVWIELSDTVTSQTIWTTKIDSKLTNLFDVQDRIVEDTVTRIAPEVRQAELRRALRKHPESLSAYDYLLRALNLIYRLERASFDTACELLKRSRETDPTFALSHAWSAWTHMYRVALGWSEDEKWDIAEATRLAELALQLDPQNARALATFGHLSAYFKHDYESALHYHSNAIGSCPNDPMCWALSSATLSYVGEGSEAVARAEKALRLSPFDKFRFYYIAVLALACYTARRYDEAAKWGRVAMNENQAFTPNLRYLAAALGASGRSHEAREVAGLLMQKHPSFTLRKYAESVLPFRNADQRQMHLEHLRAAELPER
jgi:TolB-like protein